MTKNDAKLSLYTRYRRLALGVKILIFMSLGVLVGALVGEKAQVVHPVGAIFIRMLMMAAIPLVFFNLVAGLASLTDVKSLGRIGGKILAYYLMTTVVALTVGLTLMQIIKPGVGMELKTEAPAELGEVPQLVDVFLQLVPDNIFRAFAEGQVSQIVVFAIFLGIAILLLPANHKAPIVRMFDALASLLRALVRLILTFAPIGIGALAASTVGRHGADIFGPLAKLIGGIWIAMAIMVLLYLTLLYLFTRMSPWTFLRKTAPLYATTASTCSSLASLAVSLQIAEERMKLPRNVFAFTLPLGAQVNKDGTSIMLAGVLLFTAQAVGVEFTLGSQITIVLIGLLLSNGSGGIPGGGLVVALIFVKAFSLPLEVAAIVGGIYQLIDMGSTTINCMGDMVGTTIVAGSEGYGETVSPLLGS